MTDDDQSRHINGAGEDMAQWLDDYVQDRLPADRKAQFEAYLLDKPELLKQVELGLAMKTGFGANRSDDAPSD